MTELSTSSPGMLERSEALVARIATEAGPVGVQELAGGLRNPWGMDYLPDGRLLVTERAGSLRILDTDGTLSAPLAGTPAVFAAGQGGLLDVAIDPDFAGNGLVYLSFAEGDAGGSGLAVGRGRLVGDAIEDFEVVFRQTFKLAGAGHYGGRIAFSPDGHLFLTMGDRQQFSPAQDNANHIGTIVRLNRDGTVPADNPFADPDDGVLDEIFTFGHRNVQGAAIHPETGELWAAEFGPLHGDELNLIVAGSNYGWPEVSWGNHYGGADIPDPPTRPELADAAAHWIPSIAPSGIAFYDGAMFGAWQGSLLLAGLVSQALIRVEVDGDSAVEVERLAMGARIRDVAQAPDGSLTVLTDSADGAVWQLVYDGLVGGGSAAADTLIGGVVTDWLQGGDGADDMWGLAGPDTLEGGGGGDRLFGNLGDDSLGGGDGADSLRGQAGADTTEGGSGGDLLFGGAGGDMVRGDDGNDVVNGNSGADRVAGGAGDDTVRGQGGDDDLSGGTGADEVLGMAGFDTLSGDAGADTLTGGVGDDLLRGGDGPDLFVFAAGHGDDTVADFAPGADAVAVVGVTAFADLDIVDTNAGARVTFEAVPTAAITLTGVTAADLDAADFGFG